MAITISNSQYNSFLTENYISQSNADGLRLFIDKSSLDKENEIKAWAASKKIVFQNQKSAIASNKVNQDAFLDQQISDMDSIVNS